MDKQLMIHVVIMSILIIFLNTMEKQGEAYSSMLIHIQHEQLHVLPREGAFDLQKVMIECPSMSIA